MLRHSIKQVAIKPAMKKSNLGIYLFGGIAIVIALAVIGFSLIKGKIITDPGPRLYVIKMNRIHDSTAKIQASINELHIKDSTYLANSINKVKDSIIPSNGKSA